MAWTAPRTWVTGETVTAALMNAQIRDNFLETSAATVTTAGDLAYADAANSMGSRLAIGAAASHLVSTSSAPVWSTISTDTEVASNTFDSSNGTGFNSLNDANWGFSTEIEVAVTTQTRALVLWKANLSNDTAGAICRLGYSVSGATTNAATDSRSIHYESGAANDAAEFGGFDLLTVTAGSNTFTLEGKVPTGVGRVANPEIAVIGF